MTVDAKGNIVAAIVAAAVVGTGTAVLINYHKASAVSVSDESSITTEAKDGGRCEVGQKWCFNYCIPEGQRCD